MKTAKRFHPYRSDLKLRARELRRNMTAPEKKLWYEFLRTAPLRFTRQKPLGSFIADFYCAGRQVAIEIDGDSHYEPHAARKDISRTAELRSEGVRVLRFTNLEVMKNFSGVCERILEELQKSPRPSGDPL
jgi:very-short-patch-repair endonuclease